MLRIHTSKIVFSLSASRALKSELAIRPIWHRVGPRVEAHIMVAFLGYCLWVCLKQKLKAAAAGLSPWQLLDPFKRIVQVEVWFKLKAGGAICLPRITNREYPSPVATATTSLATYHGDTKIVDPLLPMPNWPSLFKPVALSVHVVAELASLPPAPSTIAPHCLSSI